MSLESWKAEYYQLDADVPEVQVDDITRTRHSLQKWIGLRPDNLKRHNLRKGCRSIIEPLAANSLAIESETCALCVAHCINKQDNRCESCPLYAQRNNTYCDSRTNEEHENDNRSPYHTFTVDGNPEPMIAALEATLQTLTTPPNETKQTTNNPTC